MMADEGEGEGEETSPVDAVPPPAEEAAPPTEPVDAAEAPPPPDDTPQTAEAEDAVPPAEDAVPPAEDIPPEAPDVPPPEFTEVDEEREEQLDDVSEYTEPQRYSTGQERVAFADEEDEGQGEMYVAKSVVRIEEPDSSLSIDEDKLDSMMDTKEQAIDKKRLKALGSTISIRNGNQEFLDRAKAPKYMNSYKLDSDKPFNPEKVEVILKDVLSEIITDDLVYDADKVMKLAMWASGAIRDKVKEQEYDRYKIVCVVSIGEKKSQDVYSIFRFLWDSERDRFASYIHENMRVYAIALCFGLYYE